MTPHLPIYLDYGATTPCDPRVVDAMIPWLREHFGNPASRSHAWGWEAEEAVEKARVQVAALLNADPREIVWTSGATESNNLAIKGAAHFYASRGRHIVTVKTEHKAVLDTTRELERQGFEVTYLDVQEDGLLDLDVVVAVTLRADRRDAVVAFALDVVGGQVCVHDAVGERDLVVWHGAAVDAGHGTVRPLELVHEGAL
jgi:cysteine desulfurase